MSKILLIGPKFNKSNPSKVGGIVVLFEDLIIQLKNQNIKFKVVDTNKDNYKNKVLAFIYIYYQFFINFTKVNHISIHGTAKDYLIIAPVVVFFSKIFNKEISTRKFAGNFNTIFDNYNPIFKNLIKYVLKNSHYNFFETKELVKFFEKFNKNTYWFPNVRDIKQTNFKIKTYSKKFVFISSVKKTKGIIEIIDTFKELDSSYTIDIYGPIQDDDLTNDKIEISSNIKYYGAIESNIVTETLIKYDILILPTYHEGEGYPGIIIEAFALGIPSISTYWNAIPELIEDGINGLLIKPKNYLDLKNKILEINELDFNSLSKNAYNSFKNFSSKEQTKHFLTKIGF
jgi:glycosyltransferase involved in cell wall biosynthesis